MVLKDELEAANISLPAHGAGGLSLQVGFQHLAHHARAQLVFLKT